ncbi:MAG TPA: hypothetical protein VKE94_18390, partial [Gemmataceae bacterium]|nr:hypothetical protein [Gemmataceae bacterium]
VITQRLDSVRTNRDRVKARLLDDGAGATRKLKGFFGRGRRRDSVDTAINPLANYCQLRLEEFLLDHAHALLAEVGRIIAHLQQELAGCRFEVKALASAIAEASKGPPLEEIAARPGLTWLVPGGLAGMPEAEHALMVSMGLNYARHVDRLLQQEILDSHGGLWAIAANAFGPHSGRRNPAEPLQKAIAARARRAVNALLENYDAATLLFESAGGEEGAWQTLAGRIAEAQPVAALPDRPRILLLGVPSSRAGDALRERACRSAASVPTMIVESSGDLVVCHELANVPPSEALPAPADASVTWASVAARVCTRTDVAWTGTSSSYQLN